MGNKYNKQIYGLGMMISTRCLRIKLKYDKYRANIDNVNIMLFIVVILDPMCNLDYVNELDD